MTSIELIGLLVVEKYDNQSGQSTNKLLEKSPRGSTISI